MLIMCSSSNRLLLEAHRGVPKPHTYKCAVTSFNGQQHAHPIAIHELHLVLRFLTWQPL